jgi:porphobilinogen synthase
MAFPKTRAHRFRRSAHIRRFVQETTLHASDLILPLFVHEGLQAPRPIATLPGIAQQSLGSVVTEVKSAIDLGIKAVILFGIPLIKDDTGENAADDDGIVQKAIRELRATFPELVIIADCCLCEYTCHGHCGLVQDGRLNNDATLEILGRIAASYARAGADVIAPSGMMDGMVMAIRSALDEHGFSDRSILSYAVKYASQFYGPFREAAGSAFKGDRRHHQMAPSQAREAVMEAVQDVEEGADFIMVKPASMYMDVIREVRDTVTVPVWAYHVSGEYAMLHAAAQQQIIDELPAALEVLVGLKRAGADHIITYYAKLVAAHLNAQP